MTKIHVLSDVHNEFEQYEVSETAKTADIIILAGDIDTGINGLPWASE